MNTGPASSGYNGSLKKKAQSLRKNATNEERKLWQGFLRNHPVQFKRQRPIAYYIADFYCPKARLVIELDGSQHFTPEGMSYDQARTQIMQQFGILVLRFTNRDVNERFRSVCDMIDHQLALRLNAENAPDAAHQKNNPHP